MRGLKLLYENDDPWFREFAQAVVERVVEEREKANKE